MISARTKMEDSHMRKASKVSKAQQSRRPNVRAGRPRTVVHRRADVPLGTEVLAAVVVEIVLRRTNEHE